MGARAQVQTSQERHTSRLGRARAGVLADRRLRQAAWAGLAWLVLYAAATALTTDLPAAREALGDLVYLLPVALAAVLSLLVAGRATGRRRRLWLLLAASNVLWLAGDLIWAGYAYVLHRQAPFPSVADGLYLASYVLVPAAVLVGFGGASGRRRAQALLDGAVVALGLGALGWQALIAPQVGDGLSPSTVTGAAYPLLGIVIVVTLVSVVFAGHRHVPSSVWLMAAAFGASALTDAGYTYLSSLNDYVSGGWLDLGWQLEAVLLCLAGLCALRHDEGEAQVDPLGADLAMVPVLVGVLAGLLLAGSVGLQHGVPVVVLLVVGAVVAGLVGRFVLSVGDSRHVAVQLDVALREQERLAVTDGLTGLYNRRFFEEVLHLEGDRAVRDRTPLALVVADLDHFKHVNDTHGHQCGDAVLAVAADRLRRALRPSDVLARYGGEEFVMILPGADAETALEVAERCRLALCTDTVRLHTGVRITLTGSFGVASLDLPDAQAARDRPAGRDDVPETLIKLADRALYAAKDGGRNRVTVASPSSSGDQDGADESGEVVRLPAALRALEQIADLVDLRLGTDEHSLAMARWAGVVADALGLEPATRDRSIIAARLHDIGKVALSDTLLSHPGPLSDAQWQLMRTHPEHGQRLLLAVPGHEQVAAVVRSHHERFDGTGYPDGRPGPELTVEARLVSVLDTWAAMLADRPYVAALTPAQARAELRSVAGSQLDPAIVEAFLVLEHAGLVGRLEQARPFTSSEG